MVRYERIISLKGVPLYKVILDYQTVFHGRDIYVSDKTYIRLLKFLGFKYDLASDVLKNSATGTRIFRSYRVPDKTAYAIKTVRSD